MKLTDLKPLNGLFNHQITLVEYNGADIHNNVTTDLSLSEIFFHHLLIKSHLTNILENLLTLHCKTLFWQLPDIKSQSRVQVSPHFWSPAGFPGGDRGIYQAWNQMDDEQWHHRCKMDDASNKTGPSIWGPQIITLLRQCLAGGWGTTATIEVSCQRGCQFDSEVFGNDPRTNGVPTAGKGKRFWQGW